MNKTWLWIICVILGLVMIPIIGFMFFVTGLGIFHLFIKCRGKTTREFLKNKDNVLGDGIGNDWFNWTPSFLKFSMIVSEEKAKELKDYIYHEEGNQQGPRNKIENEDEQHPPMPVNIKNDAEQYINENKVSAKNNIMPGDKIEILCK